MISPISNRRLSQALCETLHCEIPVSTGAQVIAHPVWLHDDGALALRAARVWLDHTHILREAVMARSAKAILGGYGQGGPTWQLPPTRSNNKSEQQNEASALSR